MPSELCFILEPQQHLTAIDTPGRAVGGWRSARSGGKVSPMLLNRVAAAGDQAVTAASGFLLTLTLARAYEPVCLAGFAIGTSLALLFQGIYRSSLVLPASLFEIGVFRARAARLAGQHIVIMAGMMAFAGAAALAVAAVDATPLDLHAAAASMVCLLLFVPTDFDRMLMLRLGHRLLPLGIASAYFALLCGLSLIANDVGLSFFWLMAVLGCFCLARMALYARLLVRPDFRRVGTFLRINVRRNVHWGVISVIAGSGYSSMPILLLGWSAPALNVAAYNAMRNLTQPLQLLLRSFDVVDKLTFSTIDRSDPVQQRSHILFVLVLYAALSGTFTLVIVAVSGPLTRLVFGARYGGFADTLMLWSVITGLTSCLAPLETVIYRTGRLRAYALLQTVAGACALLVALLLIPSLKDLGAVAATLLGTTIAFLGLVGICAPFLGWSLPSWSRPPRRPSREAAPGSAADRPIHPSSARPAAAERDASRTAGRVAGAGGSTHGRKTDV